MRPNWAACTRCTCWRRKASVYGLPENPKYPVGATLSNVLKPVGNLAIGAAIVGSVAAFFITRRNIHMEEVE